MWLPDRHDSFAATSWKGVAACEVGTLAGRAAPCKCGREVGKAVEMMNCEEFELRGLDLDRSDGDPKEGSEAAAHARVCGHCSALLESWREVKGDLRLLREATRVDSAPARVEMRLRQELCTRREARVPRSAVTISAWALAAAAVLIGAVSWGVWQRARHQEMSKVKVAAPSAPADSTDRVAGEGGLQRQRCSVCLRSPFCSTEKPRAAPESLPRRSSFRSEGPFGPGWRGCPAGTT